MCLVWGVVYCLLGGNFNSKYKVWAKFSTFTDISFTLSRSNISYFSDISSMCYEILLISSHNTTLTLKILYTHRVPYEIDPLKPNFGWSNMHGHFRGYRILFKHHHQCFHQERKILLLWILNTSTCTYICTYPVCMCTYK